MLIQVHEYREKFFQLGWPKEKQLESMSRPLRILGEMVLPMIVTSGNPMNLLLCHRDLGNGKHDHNLHV